MALSKGELEIQKLELEIKEIKINPITKASTWHFLTTIIIPAGTLWVFYHYGAFDARGREQSAKEAVSALTVMRLENREDTLKVRISRFEADSISLYLNNKKLNDSVDNLKYEIDFRNKALSAIKRGNKEYAKSVFNKLQAESQGKFRLLQGDLDVANMVIGSLKQKLQDLPPDSTHQFRWEIMQLNEELRRWRIGMYGRRKLEPITH